MTASDEPADGVRVNDRIVIPRHELTARATRAGGPGGQHVNTSSTRIELLWRIDTTDVLTPEERDRVRQKLISRLDADGSVRIVASDSRSQRQNREAAEARLAELVRAALLVPKARRRTRPSRAAKQARLDAKKRLSEKKRERRWRGE